MGIKNASDIPIATIDLPPIANDDDGENGEQ